MFLVKLVRFLRGLAAASVGWSGSVTFMLALLATGIDWIARPSSLSSLVKPGMVWPWLILWSLFVAPLIVWSLLAKEYSTGLELLMQALFGVACGIVLLATAAHPTLRWWIFAGIASMVIAATLSSYYTPRLLSSYESAVVVIRLSPQGLVQRVTSAGAGAVAHRAWLVSAGQGYILRGQVRVPARALDNPPSLTFALDWPGRTVRAQTSIVPTGTWTPFEIEVAGSETGNPAFFIMRIFSNSPGTFEVKGVLLRSVTGPPPRIPRATRLELLAGNPVLLAHLAVAIAAALLAATGTSLVGLGGIVGVALIAWFAQSRGALAVIAVWAFLVPLTSSWGKQKKFIVAIAIVAAVLGAGIFIQSSRLDALQSAPSRPSIWALALEAFLSFPILGLQGEGITSLDYFNGTSLPDVTHAHNFVLQFAMSYGIFGALSATILLGGILALAYRNGRVLGLVLLLPIVILNVFDSTLLNASILVATTLAINVLARRRELASTLGSPRVIEKAPPQGSE